MIIVACHVSESYPVSELSSELEDYLDFHTRTNQLHPPADGPSVHKKSQNCVASSLPSSAPWPCLSRKRLRLIYSQDL